MGEPPKLHIGTSGWHYGHWRGPFYPPDLAPARFLKYYSGFFRTVEVNNTFYQLPREEVLHTWRESAPPGFVFAVKASRFITHLKKLKEPEQSLGVFLERVGLLGEKLGPVLFQLPPGWGLNLARLEDFLAVLPGGRRYAFEFRDPRWLDPAVSQALARRGAAFCIYDFAGRQSPLEVTADFVYVRLHGPGGPYQGSYGPTVLDRWAGLIKTWLKEGKEVFCYFDNDEAGYAVKNALELKKRLASALSTS